MPKKDVVVVGGSVGGLEALRAILAGLPATLGASIFVVLHTAPDAPGLLAEILDRAGPLPVAYAQDGERFAPGRVYVAPPDRHLVLEPGVMRLTRGPKENRFRPAVDPLFRSAASVFGPRLVGVILSGGLDDGTAGLWAVKRLGGVAVVQDPGDAVAPSMPECAAATVAIDYSLPAASLAPLLVRLADTDADVREEDAVPREIDIEVKIAKQDNAIDVGVRDLGHPASYACPECHGVLLQLEREGRVRFRCHTGHAYAVESLLSEMEETAEEALWSAIRSLEEALMLMKDHARHLAKGPEADRLAEKVRAAERRSDLVRRAVMNGDETVVGDSPLPPSQAAD